MGEDWDSAKKEAPAKGTKSGSAATVPKDPEKAAAALKEVELKIARAKRFGGAENPEIEKLEKQKEALEKSKADAETAAKDNEEKSKLEAEAAEVAEKAKAEAAQKKLDREKRFATEAKA